MFEEPVQLVDFSQYFFEVEPKPRLELEVRFEKPVQLVDFPQSFSKVDPKGRLELEVRFEVPDSAGIPKKAHRYWQDDGNQADWEAHS